MTKRDMLNILTLVVKQQTNVKQSTRLLKIHCTKCGFIARTTSKWIHAMPVCGTCSQYMEVA